MNLGVFLKEQNDSFVFIGERLEAYIPSMYEEKHLFEQNADSIKAFGVFRIKVFEKGKCLIDTFLNIPSVTYFYPSEVRHDFIEMDDDEDEEKEKYIICTFKNGDDFTMINPIQDIDNIEMFFNILFAGKITGISYKKIINIWINNMEFNGTNLGVPLSVNEMIIREIYRNPKKSEECFAVYMNRHKDVKDTDYRAANVREICARNSTFAALSFEDMDAMLTYSINRTNYNKEQRISPVEKIMKM